MKPFIFSLFLFVVGAVSASAQKMIVRQSNGTPHFYTKLDSAITEASANDTIYLPDGYFDLNVPIDKKLHFIGVGHHPKNSETSGVTYIGGSVNFEMHDLSAGSTLQGLYLNHGIVFHEGVNNLLISRCNVGGTDNTGTNFIENITISECIFRTSVSSHLIYSHFNNCIFQENFRRQYRSCNFSNCLFLTGGWPFSPDWSNLGVSDYSEFTNNVFFTADAIVNCGNCIFRNNLFAGIPEFDGVSLVGFANQTGVSVQEIFSQQSGNVFSYDYDYNIVVENYKTAGTGGTEPGIYGGPSPWKDSTTPSNPVIESKTISGYTNADGTLNVQIKVSAQER